MKFAFSRLGLSKLLLYTFLITGYLNTILRVNEESNITLFRILLPLALFYLFIKSQEKFTKLLIILIVLLLYGILNSYLISQYNSFNFIYFLHYFTLIFLAFLVWFIVEKFGVFSLYTHLRAIYIVMIILSLFQFLTDFEFPNTHYLGTINIYYWVDNDFAAALAAFIPFLWVSPDKRSSNRLLAILGVIIIAYNSSRIALLSIVFFAIFISLNRFRWVGYILAATFSAMILLLLKDYKLGGDSLYQLIVDPFRHIFMLEPYHGKWGSVYDRTNALIFGIKEIINTWGFGVGPGNATAMLQLPEYNLATAESMHNFTAQIFVEYGWLMMSFIFLAVIAVYKQRKKLEIKRNSELVVYLVTMALASLSQSEGLFSNYYFFICFYASFSFFGNAYVVARRQETPLFRISDGGERVSLGNTI